MTTTKALLEPYAEWLATQTPENGIFGTTGYVALLHAEARHVANVRNEIKTPHRGWKNEFPLEHNTLLGRMFKQLRTSGGTINAPGMREAINSDDDVIYKTAHGIMAASTYVDGIKWWDMTSDQLVNWLWNNSPMD